MQTTGVAKLSKLTEKLEEILHHQTQCKQCKNIQAQKFHSMLLRGRRGQKESKGIKIANRYYLNEAK